MTQPCTLIPHHHHHLLLFSFFLLLLLTLLPTPSLCEEEEATADVSVAKGVAAVEEGHEIVIECTRGENETLKDVPVHWTFQATGQRFTENATLRVWANFSSGALTVKEARLNDTGIYACSLATSPNRTATVDLHVYTLPSYEEEGIVLGVVSAALLLLVLVGSALQYRAQRRKEKDSKDRLRTKTLVLEAQSPPSTALAEVQISSTAQAQAEANIAQVEQTRI